MNLDLVKNYFKKFFINSFKKVDATIKIIQNAISNGMDWIQLAKLVKEEKKKGDIIANSIHALKLNENKITLLLTSTNESDEDDQSITLPAQLVLLFL